MVLRISVPNESKFDVGQLKHRNYCYFQHGLKFSFVLGTVLANVKSIRPDEVAAEKIKESQKSCFKRGNGKMRYVVTRQYGMQEITILCLRFILVFSILVLPLYGADQETFKANSWNKAFQECIDGNCVNGKGTMVYYSTQKYIGEFKDGRRHGQGTLYLPLDRVLKGNWRDDELVEGTVTFADGTRYSGTWEFGYRHGHGVLTYPDGRKYIGEFHAGNRHGQGTMKYPDGRIYKGEFKNGKRTGIGTMTYPNSQIISGQFLDGNYIGPVRK